MTAAKILVGLLTLSGLGGVLFFLFTSAISSPVGFGIGMVAGGLYLALLLWFISRSPMWPGRGRRCNALWVACALVAGSGGAMWLTVLPAVALIEAATALGWDNAAASWAGGYPEEVAKALIVALILLAFSQFDRPWHGLIVGAVVGAGFEIFENVLYGVTGAVMDPESDAVGAAFTWGLRVIVGPGLHVVFAAIAGWGVGWALHKRNIGPAVVWTFAAVALHFAWNYLMDDAAYLAKNTVVGAVMYATIIVLVRRGNRHARTRLPGPGWVRIPYPAEPGFNTPGMSPPAPGRRTPGR